MENTTDGDETSDSVEPAYIYTGPKTTAKLKLRLAEWLERRGW
jgi:hypothetical protein